MQKTWAAYLHRTPFGKGVDNAAAPTAHLTSIQNRGGVGLVIA